jgi:lysophospholipase L1-like esterase
MSLLIQNHATVLFQGDSITDAGRDRQGGEDLGRGYAMLAAAWFAARHPERRVRFINRGIGGDRIADLEARWQADAIDLRPAWLSIMVGINNTWRRYDRDDPTPHDLFEAIYRRILGRARDELGARLVILEPFIVPVSEQVERMREDLDPKIAIVRRLAREHEAIYVPLDGIFAAAAARREPAFWSADGVHPSLPGHALIAQAWLAAVGAVG